MLHETPIGRLRSVWPAAHTLFPDKAGLPMDSHTCNFSSAFLARFYRMYQVCSFQ